MTRLSDNMSNPGTEPFDAEGLLAQLYARWEQVASLHADLQAPNTDFQILFWTAGPTDRWKVVGEMNTVQQLGLSEKPQDSGALIPLYHPLQAGFIDAMSKAFSMMMAKPENAYLLADLLYFAFNLPLRYPDGQYYLVRVLSAPFKIGDQTNLFPIMNYYHKLDIYRGEPLSPHFEMKRQDRVQGKELLYDLALHATASLRQDLKAHDRKFLFTSMEKEVLKAYHQNPEMTIGGLAHLLHRGEKTVADYNKSILKKARTLFPKSFEKGKEVAEYWGRQGLGF